MCDETWDTDYLQRLSAEDTAYVVAQQYVSKLETGNQALRYNSGKPQLSMVDLKCLEPCARVLEYGAKKYARDNWKKGMDVSKIVDSLLRHIGDLQAGKTIDEESGQLIIGHIQCNALFLGNPNNTDDLSKSKDSVNGVNCS